MGGADDGGTLCGGCAVVTAPLSGPDQSISYEIDFGPSGVNLVGATITARIWLRSGGPSGQMQLHVHDTTPSGLDDASPARTLSSTTRTDWFDYTRAVPNSGTLFDPTSIRRIVFRVSSGISTGTQTWSTTVIWIDSITIARNTGTVPGPFTFDTSHAPMAILGTPEIGPGYSLTWLP
jgi:hypothetical protein